MVVELIGAAFAFALGWFCLRPLAPVTGYALAAAAAFPIGAAIWVAASAMSIAAMIPFNPVAGWLMALTAAGIVNLYWGRRPTRREARLFAAGGALILVAVALFASFEWTIFNTDALWTFYMADDLAMRGFFSDPVRKVQLGAEPIYLPLVSAYARGWGEAYLMSFSPMMLICSGGLFAALGSRAAAPSDESFADPRTWIPVLGAAALITTGFYVQGALQVKTHGVYALHMLGATAALYLAGREGRTEWFVLALLFAAPMVLSRLESGVSALPILVVAAAIPTIPLRMRLWGVGTVAVAWGLSYLYLLGATTYFGGFERGLVSKKLIWIGFPPGIFGAILLSAAIVDWNGRHQELLGRLVSWLPAAMIATLIALLVGHAAAWPETFGNSVRGILSIVADPSLGGLGYGAAILAFLSLSLILRPRVPWVWTLMVPAVSYLIILVLADVHLEGFPHWGPTGALTRIATHVIPTLLFYALVRILASVPRPERREAHGTS